MTTVPESGSLPQTRLTVPEYIDEDEFFEAEGGGRTLVTHTDLEAAVPNEDKPYLREIERYWVNKPFAFVVIYRDRQDQELRYIVVEPRLNETEEQLIQFFEDKLKVSMDYENTSADATPEERAQVIKEETVQLMKRYNLVDQNTFNDDEGFFARLKAGVISTVESATKSRKSKRDDELDPIPVPREDDTGELRKLTDEQIQKILYYLVRNFIRYGKIDAIKHDINVEDIACDGYGEEVFIYHTEYESVITNVAFGKEDLDDFVVNLAQLAGKGISKRQPNIDATLRDGSRAQLTLGTEISDHGTNFTIRQFKEVPFTPVDLINWGTYSLDAMVYLWLCIENEKSAVFAGGTASGKTTTLNAMSLFIPGNRRIVSIEDTREIEIPQKNWVADTTRDSFQGESEGEIDEFELLTDSLRKRPDYIILGEVRGEESRSLFQTMNSGHTVYTTFHAEGPRDAINRFSGDPINVPKPQLGTLDILCTQVQRTIGGKRVRRNTGVIEIKQYLDETDDFAVRQIFDYEPSDDEFTSPGLHSSSLLDDIKQEQGWSASDLEVEMQRRKIVLAYLLRHNINTYAGVAATLQAYMNAPDTVLALIAEDNLRGRINNLRTMKNVEIDVDPELEELVPRPNPSEELREQAADIVDSHEDLLQDYSEEDIDIAEPVEDSGENRDSIERTDIDGDLANGERSQEVDAEPKGSVTTIAEPEHAELEEGPADPMPAGSVDDDGDSPENGPTSSDAESAVDDEAPARDTSSPDETSNGSESADSADDSMLTFEGSDDEVSESESADEGGDSSTFGGLLGGNGMVDDGSSDDEETDK